MLSCRTLLLRIVLLQLAKIEHASMKAPTLISFLIFWSLFNIVSISAFLLLSLLFTFLFVHFFRQSLVLFCICQTEFCQQFFFQKLLIFCPLFKFLPIKNGILNFAKIFQNRREEVDRNSVTIQRQIGFQRLGSALTGNVLQLGEVADLEALTFNLALMFI